MFPTNASGSIFQLENKKARNFAPSTRWRRVPALTDGPLAVAESGAICAYVAEAHPEAALAPPVGDPARGRYLRWLFFSPGCVEQAFLVKSVNVSVRPEAAGFGDFDRVFDVLEAAVVTGPWLLGERFSAADVMIGLDLHFGIDLFKLVPLRGPRCAPMWTAASPARRSSAPRRSRQLGREMIKIAEYPESAAAGLAGMKGRE